MVSPFCHHDPNPAIFFPLADKTARDGFRLPVFEHHSSLEPRQLFLLWDPRYLHQVGLWNRKLGMGEEMGKVPIIGEEKEPLRIEIKATHWIDSPFHIFKEIQDSGP